MGAALQSLVAEATAPVDDKIKQMQGALAAQTNVMKKVEEGFNDRYTLYLNKLKDDKIHASWGEHKLSSEVKITKGHEDLTKLGTNIIDSVGNMAKSAIGGIEGDGTTLKGSVGSVFNDLKEDLQSAIKVFLGSQVGIEKSLSKNLFLVQGNNIKLIYLQTYNTTLEASGLDGEKKISVYVYLLNSAVVNIFQSDISEIITKLGNSKEKIEELKVLLTSMKELEAIKLSGDNRALPVVPAANGDDHKRAKVSNPEAEARIKKIEKMQAVINAAVA